jgi:hypothetical protein
MTLYQALINAKVEVSNWQSDLYAPDNVEVREILKGFPSQTRSRFRSDIDGSPMFEFPFAFDPFWERRKPTGETK